MRISNRWLTWFSKANQFHFWLLALPCLYYAGMNYSVDLDDAFLYFRVVNTMLDTGKPEFNPGDGCFMVTSPLWTFVLAGIKRVVPFVTLPEIAKISWILFQLLAAWFAFLAFRHRLKNWAPFVCIPFLVPNINTMMGNEIALLYAAFFGTLWAVFTRRSVVAGLFLGIGYLARGEFAFMFLVIIADYLIAVKAQDINRGGRGIIRELAIIAGTAVLVASVWHVYNLSVFHAFFPATLNAKLVQGQLGRFGVFKNDLWKYTRLFGLHGHVWMLGLIAVGIVRQLHWAILVGIYLVLHSLMYAYLELPAYHWYYYDAYLFALLFLFFGLFAVADFVRALVDKVAQGKRVAAAWRKAAPVLGITLVLGFSVWFMPVRFRSLALRPMADLWKNRALSERYSAYVAASRFLRKGLHEEDTVLAPEVGILSFHLRGHEIRDTNGLATPGLRPEQIGNYDYLVGNLQPRFIVLPLKTEEQSLLFVRSDNAFFYRRIFIARPRAQEYVGNVYERRELSPLLKVLYAKGRGSPQLRYALIGQDPVLFCQAPYEAEIALSGQFSRITMEIGFSPKLLSVLEKASRLCNGVDITVWGLSDQQEPKELIGFHIDPFDGTELTEPRRVDMSIPSGFTKIRVRFDPVHGNKAYDWICVKAIDAQKGTRAPT